MKAPKTVKFHVRRNTMKNVDVDFVVNIHLPAVKPTTWLPTKDCRCRELYRVVVDDALHALARSKGPLPRTAILGFAHVCACMGEVVR